MDKWTVLGYGTRTENQLERPLAKERSNLLGCGGEPPVTAQMLQMIREMPPPALALSNQKHVDRTMVHRSVASGSASLLYPENLRTKKRD
jgi:hypothetical protein